MEPKTIIVEEVSGLPVAVNNGDGTASIRVTGVVANNGTYVVQQTDAAGKPTTSPDKVDTISATIFYEGWTSLSLVRKTDISVAGIKTVTWGSGTWANRATLTYS